MPPPASLLRRSLTTSVSRHAAAAATTVGSTSTSKPKKSGSIADVFSSLSGKTVVPLPAEYAELKRELWRDGMVDRWREILADLDQVTADIQATGPEIVPRLPFQQIKRGEVDPDLIRRIKETGTVIVEGVQTEQQALQWKDDILAYAERNKEHVTGYPSDNIQVFELYNTRPTREAQTHPNTVLTHQFLLSGLLHASDPVSKISLRPIVYGDRLRIRQPGDTSFKLGAHIDGGSLERWQDPGFRKCFSKLLDGSSHWTSHDAFDVSPRIDAVTDLFRTGNGQCSVFRPWQGWASMSYTGPTEGTLKVYPSLRLSTAYVLLRPFFRPRSTDRSLPGYLDAANWVPDLESTAFPGSVPGNGQEMDDTTHPHLRLDRALIPVPKVRPGDHVFWSGDTIHAVESVHNGSQDSSVIYVPAVPLSAQNAAYLKRQAEHYAQGIPAPDFPQGQGESLNVGRSTPNEITDPTARQMLGLEPMAEDGATEGEREVLREANRILFG